MSKPPAPDPPPDSVHPWERPLKDLDLNDLNEESMLIAVDADGADEVILGDHEGEDGVEGVVDWGAGFFSRQGFFSHNNYTIIDYDQIMRYYY